MSYGKDWTSLLDRTIWQQIYADDSSSWEGYFGTTADLFNVGDFSLFGSLHN